MEGTATSPAACHYGQLRTLAKIARPTVYDRLRQCGIKVLEFAPRNGRCRKIVPMGEILKFESGQLRRL